MAVLIHPHAVVHKDAYLDEDVEIGPYAVIDAGVRVRSGTRIGPFAYITGNTDIGSGCRIFSHAVIGSIPQDLKFKGEESFLTIGSGNTIREFVTINPGTGEGSNTRIGNDNLMMAYSHIAHNCILGDNNVLANNATLAGHVKVGTRAVIGGLVAIHQFCRIGNFSIIGGCSKVVQDIPPYSMCDGHPAKLFGLNRVGLRRARFGRETVETLKSAFKILFFEGHSLDSAKEILTRQYPSSKETACLLEFIFSSKRGVCTANSHNPQDE